MVRLFRACSVLMASVLVVIAIPAAAFAATTNSLYSYDLRSVNGSVVANGAAANVGANLTLYGNWSSVNDGVNFSGNLTDQQSIGTYTPTSGTSLNLSASQPLAFGVQFTYSAPVGASCFGDSTNLTQIGRFAANEAQAKLQFTKCGKTNGDSNTQVFMQCRMAGSNTPSSVLPVTSSLPLQNGANYLATCSKGADVGSANNVALSVTKLDPLNGNQTTTDTFNVASLGAMNTKQYLSVGNNNKYPIAVPSKNTDQYNGLITKVAYCTGGTAYDANSCLGGELPVAYQSVTPPPAQPVVTLSYGDGLTQVHSGDTITYTTAVTNPSADVTVSGAVANATIPANTTFLGADDNVQPVGSQLSWNVGDLAPGQSVVKQFTVTANAGLVNNEQVTSNATVTTADSACQNAASACAVSDTDTAVVAPQFTQYITNPSVETTLDGWNQKYNAQSVITRANQGYDGSWSVQVAQSAATAGPAGFNASPRPVSSTTAGTTYTGTGWVRVQTPNQTISTILKEVDGNGTTLGSKTVALTLADTNWHQITVNYTAAANGNQLLFNFFAKSLAQNDWFRADDFSLSSPN